MSATNTVKLPTNEADDRDPQDQLCHSFEPKAIKRGKATFVVSHWATLIENLTFSSQEFYARLNNAIAQRQIPDLDISRVRWPEGGILSAHREYVRFQRKDLLFDVCAAPFGSGFFVSKWCGEKSLRLGWLLFLSWMIIVFGNSGMPLYHSSSSIRNFVGWDVQSYLYVFMFIRYFGITTALVLIFFFPRATLSSMPIVGPLYIRFFGRSTYYRIDLRCMYEQAVQAAVLEVIDGITKAHGVRPLSERERTVTQRDFFSIPGANDRLGR